jgi:hypothetical protein
MDHIVAAMAFKKSGVDATTVRYIPYNAGAKAMVGLLSGADLVELADVYRRFYPLFQSAYVDLGYPDGYFNDRLVEVIDHLLETPEISDPVSLTRPHVLYEFADPELEGLSSGQKLLLRMGAEHRSRVKQALREFRDIATQL